jgi:hypothetical protein
LSGEIKYRAEAVKQLAKAGECGLLAVIPCIDGQRTSRNVRARASDYLLSLGGDWAQ